MVNLQWYKRHIMPQKSIFIKFFRNVKRVFNNVLKLDLNSVWCLTAEESSTEVKTKAVFLTSKQNSNSL
jgi:hypothetical protein